MKHQVTLTKNNIKILICCHKPCDLPPNSDEIFFPIHVGAAISNVTLGIQRDDQINGSYCDNISSKNKNYCELTALYWAWKNIKKIYPDLEYIGLNHYRRYFSFDKKNSFDDSIIISEKEVSNYNLNKSALEKILSKYDAIMAKPRMYPYPLEIDYSVCHVSDDIRTLKQIIHELYPEYDRDFYNVITCNNKLSPYNMTIIKWNDFDRYCTWLFNILFKAEQRINIANYNAVQSRIFGYMAERLFNVWVEHAQLKKKYLNIIKFSNDNVQKKINQFKRLIKLSLAFNINYKPITIRRFFKK